MVQKERTETAELLYYDGAGSRLRSCSLQRGWEVLPQRSPEAERMKGESELNGSSVPADRDSLQQSVHLRALSELDVERILEQLLTNGLLRGVFYSVSKDWYLFAVHYVTGLPIWLEAQHYQR